MADGRIATTTLPFIVNNYSSERLSTTVNGPEKVKTEVAVSLPPSHDNSTRSSGITTPSEVSVSIIYFESKFLTHAGIILFNCNNLFLNFKANLGRDVAWDGDGTKPNADSNRFNSAALQLQLSVFLISRAFMFS